MLDAEADLIEPFRFPAPPRPGRLRLSGDRSTQARGDARRGQRRCRADAADLDELVAEHPGRQSPRPRELENRAGSSSPETGRGRHHGQRPLGGDGDHRHRDADRVRERGQLAAGRAEGRQQELAIRAALGAGAGRIVRALLVESVLLGLMGGALGLALAYVGLHFLLAIAPAGLPRLSEISVDTRALGFTLVLSLLSGLLFGSVPALKYARPRISAALHGGATSSRGAPLGP